MKKIIHVDLDCYYAAIEMRDNPSLKNVPLAIGGKDGRGVIATCNYIAREYGVRSAMPTAQALKLCPNLTVLSGDMKKYREVSKQIHEIFLRYTQIIEPLSLDEAYLDVTNSSLFHGSATLIAQDIRRTIESELNLTASAGVAPLKFVAKVASDINKPNGICVVTPDELQQFIDDLDLGKISGVGKVTLEKLHFLGLRKGIDLKNYDRHQLFKRFGKFGHTLWQRCNAIDNRDVVVSRVRKSVGVERTFSEDIHTLEQCYSSIDTLYSELQRRVEKALDDKKITKLGVKLKFNDFKQTTVEHKHDKLELDFFRALCNEAMMRAEGRGIRLIGLSVGVEPIESDAQLSFHW